MRDGHRAVEMGDVVNVQRRQEAATQAKAVTGLVKRRHGDSVSKSIPVTLVLCNLIQNPIGIAN